MTPENSLAHNVSANVLFDALNRAIKQCAKEANTSFVSPENSRAYKCSAPECSRFALARGLCNAHYLRQKNNSDPSAPIRSRKRNSLCSECGEKTSSKGGWGLCQKHYRQVRYRALKDAAIQAFGGQCAHCQGSFHRAVFDFHHFGDKLGSPSKMFLNDSLEKLASELSKCILLCANCHRMEHFDELR